MQHNNNSNANNNNKLIAEESVLSVTEKMIDISELLVQLEDYHDHLRSLYVTSLNTRARNCKAMLRLRRLVTGLSLRWPGFSPEFFRDLRCTLWHWDGFSLSSSGFPYQYHSTVAPHTYRLSGR
jgi:hypothetical protein